MPQVCWLHRERTVVHVGLFTLQKEQTCLAVQGNLVRPHNKRQQKTSHGLIAFWLGISIKCEYLIMGPHNRVAVPVCSFWLSQDDMFENLKEIKQENTGTFSMVPKTRSGNVTIGVMHCKHQKRKWQLIIIIMCVITTPQFFVQIIEEVAAITRVYNPLVKNLTCHCLAGFNDH